MENINELKNIVNQTTYMPISQILNNPEYFEIIPDSETEKHWSIDLGFDIDELIPRQAD